VAVGAASERVYLHHRRNGAWQLARLRRGRHCPLPPYPVQPAHRISGSVRPTRRLSRHESRCRLRGTTRHSQIYLFIEYTPCAAHRNIQTINT